MSKRKILIAEDDGFFEKLLQQILSPIYELVITRNGNDAWDELRQPGAPRLAILDWVMPGLTGPQVCRKVRACPELSSAYLILLTAKNNEPDIIAGLRSGADDYITKPPLPAELRARVRIGERVLSLLDVVEAQSGPSEQEPLWSVMSVECGASHAQCVDGRPDVISHAGKIRECDGDCSFCLRNGVTMAPGPVISRESRHS